MIGYSSSGFEDLQADIKRRKDNFVNIYTSNKATVPSEFPDKINSSTDDILFGNYLCISDKKRVKLFASKDQYRKFAKQNHTEFENDFTGSTSEMYK